MGKEHDRARLAKYRLNAFRRSEAQRESEVEHDSPIPSQIYSLQIDDQDLAKLREISEPLRPKWKRSWIAVLSCGSDGRIFHPVEGDGDEDLREEQWMLPRLSTALLTNRPEGGRIYVSKDGAYTWSDKDRENVRFLEFLSPESLQGAATTPAATENDGSNGQHTTVPEEDEPANKGPSREFDRLRRSSELPSVGIGKVHLLWQAGYRTLENIQDASQAELLEIPGIGPRTASELTSSIGRIIAEYSTPHPPQKGGPEKTEESSLSSEFPEQSNAVETGNHRTDDICHLYSAFQEDPVEQLRLQVIRERAAEIRSLLKVEEQLTDSAFEEEIYQFESQTIIGGRRLTGAFFNPGISFHRPLIEELKADIKKGRYSLQGNYLWGGDYRFAPQIEEQDERLALVRRIARIVSSIRLNTRRKIDEISDLRGMGPVSTSGLLTIWDPSSYTLYYKKSLGGLGFQVTSLQDLRVSVPQILEKTGAADGLEFGRFLWIWQNGAVERLLSRFGK